MGGGTSSLHKKGRRLRIDIYMALTYYIVKKWALTFVGKNSFNCNQDEGKCYSKTEVKGYYNNLTEKITKFGLPGNQLPKTQISGSICKEFSIDIFQYGIAAYDLYLLTNDAQYLDKLNASAEWALAKQQADGGWDAFSHKKPNCPQSAMAQGEAISMLIRAYQENEDERYLAAIHKAKNFMLRPVEEGGTTVYKNGKPYFYEYINDPLVLNGWIFSAWGLYDYAKFFKDEGVMNVWNSTVDAMVEKLHEYDNGDWSFYSDNGRSLANPFYHKLHIAQLNVMYDLTGKEEFKKYSEIFQRYQANPWYRVKTFIKKVVVKIKEKEK